MFFCCFTEVSPEMLHRTLYRFLGPELYPAEVSVSVPVPETATRSEGAEVSVTVNQKNAG